MTAEEYIQRLTEASARKYEFLQKMLQLTQSQTLVIGQEKVEELQQLVAEKQQVIQQIDKVDDEFQVYFQRMKKILGVASLDELNHRPSIPGVQKLQAQIKSVMELLKEISGLEKLNEEKAKMLAEKLKNHIRQLNQGKTVNNAYMPRNLEQTSYFIDRKK